MMRWLVMTLACVIPASAQAFCLLGCDTEFSEPTAAKAAFEIALGQPLPPSVKVEHILQGGFQDKYLKVVLTTDWEGNAALLPMLGIAADTSDEVNAAQLAPGDPDWWTPQDHVALFGGAGKLPGYAETTVAFAPFPGTYDFVTLYIFAFQT